MNENRYLPGLKPVLELLKQAPHSITKIYCKQRKTGLERLLAIAQSRDVEVEFLPDSQFTRLLAKDAHARPQGVIAQLAAVPSYSVRELLDMTSNAPLKLVLALDQIRDPGNLGTLCRTAWALGVGGLILPQHNSAGPGAGASKASAGAIAKIPIAWAVNLGHALDDAEEQGFTIVGAAVSTQDARRVNAYAFSWPLPGVLVLGSEDKGMRPGIQKRCHYLAEIPFARDFDSLNVAQAGAILIALCARVQALQ